METTEPYFFGEYLIAQGLVTEQSLATALALQHKSYLPVGAIALKMGHLTTEQVTKIHREQRTRNSKFLELAVELGFMKESAIPILLKEQKNHHIHLGDALVQAEVLEPDACARALEAFMDIETARDARVETAIVESKSPIYMRSFLDTTARLLRRFGVPHAKLVKGDANVTSARVSGSCSSITFTGAWHGTYFLSVTEGVLKAVASSMLEERITELETSGDCFREFVNIVVGQAKGAFPDPGNMKMGMPKFHPEPTSIEFVGAPGSAFKLALSLRVGGLEHAVIGVVEGGTIS